MPSHDHEIRNGWGAGNMGSSWFRVDENNPKTKWESISPNGGDKPHNNMPAYQSLYAWRRTA